MRLSLWLRYGLAGGTAALVLTLVPYALLQPGPDAYALVETAGYVSMFGVVLAVYFAARRGSVESAGAGWSELFQLGARVSAVAGVVYAAGAWFAFETLLPEALPRLLAAYEQHLRAQAMSGAELDAALARLESGRRGFLDPAFQAVVMGFTLLVIGLLLSLYAAFRFRAPPVTHPRA
jgi:hypothetical protein